MNICLLTESVNGVGGAEAVVRLLAAGLADRGHFVSVISLDQATSLTDWSQHRFERMSLNSAPTDGYVAREGHGNAYRAYWLARCFRNPELQGKLEAVIKTLRPDVIHTHKTRGFPRNLWPWLKRISPVKLIHTCHDIELLSPLHNLSVGSNNNLKRAIRHSWSGLFRAGSTFVDTVTSPSKYMLDLHLDAGLFAGGRARVIANFPDLDDLVGLGELGKLDSDEPLKVLFMGRLEWAKGLLSLCEAVTRMVQSGHKIELRIAGDGALRGRIEDFDKRYDFIKHVGVVQGEEKAALFKWSHVVAAPSKSDETFCMVAAEAICAGRPVLASARGGLPEVVTDGVTGWLCDDGNLDAVMQGLRRVISARGELADFSRRCILEAGRFSRPALIAEYEAEYCRFGGGLIDEQPK